ncbi:MAG: hypothetical protein ACTSPD_06550 [Promethearchaeota archaeon]
MGQIKAILWGLLFFLAALIFIIIPTYLIWIYYEPLANLTIDEKPVYTYALFAVFAYIITIIITMIMVAAGCRAIVQRKSEDLGIPKAVKGFGLISTMLVITFMIIWYILFSELAFFALTSSK